MSLRSDEAGDDGRLNEEDEGPSHVSCATSGLLNVCKRTCLVNEGVVV
jgi:hypothetical protein